ncbi:MAG TPA: hypothetical protein VHI52_05200, partial [Verrucomicrobiae bacterium]|nr:hypothetical protein [Verrucomicrobiae bacterium]
TPTAGAANSSPLALTDSLAIRQVVDASANALAADFVNGSVVVNPTPSLNIARDGQNVTLSWPLWATNFTLQEADAPLTSTVVFTNAAVVPSVNGGQVTVTVPASGAARLYRLQAK